MPFLATELFDTPAQTTLIATSTLPRVAREYGQIWCASFTMGCAKALHPAG